MSASIAIQVLPKAENDTELVRIVDEVIAYIKSCGLRCEVGPFETTIEGDSYDQLMDIVKECQHVRLYKGGISAGGPNPDHRPENHQTPLTWSRLNYGLKAHISMMKKGNLYENSLDDSRK